MTDADPRVICTGCANYREAQRHNYTERACTNAVLAGLRREYRRAEIGQEFATNLQNCGGFVARK